jgi:hypothetical protein
LSRKEGVRLGLPHRRPSGWPPRTTDAAFARRLGRGVIGYPHATPALPFSFPNTIAPQDRLIIATALTHGATPVSRDDKLPLHAELAGHLRH